MYFIYLFFLSLVHSLNYETHFLIARMANDLLDPKIVEKAEAMLAEFSDKTTVSNEKKHSLVECVVYADVIKRAGGGYQSKWHYDD